MNIQTINEEFYVCKVKEIKDIDFLDPYCFVGKTDEELSLVCTKDFVPKKTTACDKGWNAFRIQGELDFSLVGILSKISKLLAEEKIGIFAISTYNTDYILTKKENYENALAILKKNGYQILR